MTKQTTKKVVRKQKINVLTKASAIEAKIGKQELFNRFNMYRVAIGMKPVAFNTVQRYHSGYKNKPEGTDATYANFIKAIK